MVPMPALPGPRPAGTHGQQALVEVDTQPPLMIVPAVRDPSPRYGQKRQADVIEMFSFVQEMGIDPIKESEMLWIAEEAFHAPLPPGWSEHTDEQGRAYFHCAATGESTWQHPMDSLFREVVNYFRRIQEVGGFWTVEDELAELEERIRKDLAEWMELFDEHGEKFYFNRQTEESRFDDPRNAVYHSLYTRIRMVAKIREHLPLLARAPRPEDPTVRELEVQQSQEREEAILIKCVVRLQAWARARAARRAAEAKRSRRDMDRMPQPLRGQLRLRLESLGPQQGGGQELVLAVTTPQRQRKAAARIQARARGLLARKRFQPRVNHRRFLESRALSIQRLARRWLERRQQERQEQQRLHRAATRLQSFWRGRQSRREVRRLCAQRQNWRLHLRSVLKVQGAWRVHQARCQLRCRRTADRTRRALLLQARARSFLARSTLLRLQHLREPLLCSFHISTASSSASSSSSSTGQGPGPGPGPSPPGRLQRRAGTRHLQPWTWSLRMAPVESLSRLEAASAWASSEPEERPEQRQEEQAGGPPGLAQPQPQPQAPAQCLLGPEARRRDAALAPGLDRGLVEAPGFGLLDLFQATGPGALPDLAATEIQRRQRGIAARKRVDQLRETLEREREAREREEALRLRATVRIQQRFRGTRERMQELIDKLRAQWLQERQPNIQVLQRAALRFTAQLSLLDAMALDRKAAAATVIQAHWRGFLARQHAAKLAEQGIWPVKAWFEYTATGRDSVHVSVQFFPNPGFSSYRYFFAFGSNEELYTDLRVMEREVEDCVGKFVDDRDIRRSGGASARRSTPSSARTDSHSLRRPRSGAWSRERAGSSSGGLMSRRASGSTAGDTETGTGAGARSSRQGQESSLDRESLEQGIGGAVGSDSLAQATELLQSVEEGRPGSENEAQAAERGKVSGEEGEGAEDEEQLAEGPQDLEASASASASAPLGQESLGKGEPALDPEMDLNLSGTGNPRLTGALRVLSNADAAVQGLAPTQERRHYAGVFRAGRFERTRAASLEQLSEGQRQEILQDLSEQRQRKLQELQKRQRRHAARQRKEQRLEAKRILGHSLPPPAPLGAGGLGAQGHAASTLPLGLAKKQNFLNNWSLGQGPRGHGQSNRSQSEPQLGQLAQAQAQAQAAEPFMPLPQPPQQRQRVWHRHVHHHVHHHQQETEMPQPGPGPGPGWDQQEQLQLLHQSFARAAQEGSFPLPHGGHLGGQQSKQKQQPLRHLSAGPGPGPVSNSVPVPLPPPAPGSAPLPDSLPGLRLPASAASATSLRARGTERPVLLPLSASVEQQPLAPQQIR